MQKLKNVDSGREFDWGRTSKDYAKFRDIYPEEYYKAIVDEGLGIAGQNCLDVGTGTGRNGYQVFSYSYRRSGVSCKKL